MNLIVFASGEGTNFQALINAINSDILDASISLLLTNNPDSNAINRAEAHDIQTTCIEWDRNNEERSVYDRRILNVLTNHKFDYVVCAGWMHILSDEFLQDPLVHNKVINLHPALYGGFIGANCIERAFEAFQNNHITYSGAMVHFVSSELDRGELIMQVKVNIYESDTLYDFEKRMHKAEKGLLVSALNRLSYDKLNTFLPNNKKLIKRGKVRDCYDIGYNMIAFVHSDRQSAFDRDICQIPGKGHILTAMNDFWMNKASHIIDNHLVCSQNNVVIAKRCQMLPVEVVVRGYITGSTQTSLWTHYKNGSRNYCGIEFPDGLVKNQRLETNVITPTTKGVVDEPITSSDIVERGLMTQGQMEYVFEKALDLFRFGQLEAEKMGLILVDTKYEFGLDRSGNIILADELHTCDSSRYWMRDTYEERFSQGLEPEKMDKDVVRDYIKKNCDDPYNSILPTIPEEHINRVKDSYVKLYNMFGGNPVTSFYSLKDPDNFISEYLSNDYDEFVVLIAGSTSDKEWVCKIQESLKREGIYCKIHYSSAHKQTMSVLNIIRENEPKKVVFVTVAGRSNALSGVVAANTHRPVIACPPFKDKMDMMVNINSSIQCPSKVPVMTILEPGNVALSVSRMFNL